MQAPTTERKFPPQAEPTTQRLGSSPPAWLAALVIGVIAIVPRCLGLADFFTIDEPYHWIARVRLFAEALSAHNWAATDITGHPGVTTMWLGALGRWLGARMGVPDLGGVGAGAAYLASLRLPLAVVNGLAVPMGYLALRRLVRPGVALLAGVLWATSPYLVAHGRLLHLDALLTSFMTLSVLLLLVAIEQRTKSKEQGAHQDSFVLSSLFFVLGSGVCAGLALLTKAPSLFMLPFAGLLLIANCKLQIVDSRNTKSAIYNLQFAMRSYLLWLGAAVLVVVLLWPVLWVAPLTAIGDVVNEILGNGGTPEPAGNFFRGQSVAAPGWLFYPAVLVLRTTPLTLIGLALLPLAVLRRRATGQLSVVIGQLSGFGDQSRLTTDNGRLTSRDSWSVEQRTILALLAFVLLFGLMMSIEPKKFDRYLLPIWPAIEILAAIGLVEIANFKLHSVKQWRKQFAIYNLQSVIFGAIVTVALMVNLAYYHPYYLAYYNPLLGGGATAQRTMLVGWGEGMEQIGTWLRGRPDLKRGPVLSWIPPTLMPFVPASPGVLDLRVPLMTKPSSYAVLYSRSIQRKESAIAEAYVRQVPPLYTLWMYGIEYASVYQLPRPFDVPLDAQFGDGLHLRGFSQQRAGSTLTITPSWDIQTDQPGGRFCFLHLLAPDGRRVAQVDAPIDQGMFAAWQAGQQFDPPFPLQLPVDLPAGQYRVIMGVYIPDGGRLPLRRGPAAPVDLDGPDALLVTTLSLP
jgi:4-amino-4-deoxy-L-arabinose transferase-like glycosyltransferase